MTYDPRLLEFLRVIPGSVIGATLVVGKSLLGEDLSDLEAAPGLSSLELTDGYNVGSGGELSIDPLTGTARFSERIRAKPGDKVETIAAKHELYTGTDWEARYAGAIVAQGKVRHVEATVTAEGYHWVKKTTYTLGGVASYLLDTTVTWGAELPEEGALTRLQRFFTVDTALCRTVHVSYLNTVKAPTTPAGESTLLGLARDFTELTKFPVRTANTHASVAALTIVPAVTFQGRPPPVLILPSASEWTSAATFRSDLPKPAFSIPPGKIQDVELIKDFDLFIGGIGKRALETGALGVSFFLSEARLGWLDTQAGNLDVGVRAPVAINFFGETKIISQVNHAFTGRHYRSSLDLTAPVEVT
jgi:hypothetical protein